MKNISTLGMLNKEQILLFKALKDKDDKLNTANDHLMKIAQSLAEFIKSLPYS